MSNTTIDTTGMIKVSCKYFIKENEIGNKCIRGHGEWYGGSCILNIPMKSTFQHCDTPFYIDWIDYIKYKNLLKTI